MFSSTKVILKSILSDPYNSTDSDRHDDSHFKVELDCSGKTVSTKREENGIARIEGPIVRMIVPGHTTKVNFSNAYLYDLGLFQNHPIHGPII